MRIPTAVLFLFFSCSLTAQDAYFTQFYATPIELNPALAGAVQGSFRATIAYRDQWQGIIENPYQTYGVFGDLRFATGTQRSNRDFFGAGFSFTADRVAAFDVNTNAVKLSGAFHKSLDERKDAYLSGGVYFGLVQRNINFESLVFDDQFNGLDGYTFGTLENLPENNYAHGDLGVGINYSVTPSQRSQFGAGMSLSHIVGASLSFFRKTPETADFDDAMLLRKFASYASANFALNARTRLLPRVVYQLQGPHSLLNFGSTVRMDLNEYNTNALHLGAGMRLAKRLDSLQPSAMYGIVGFELSSFLIGLSYDLNLEDLSNERLGQNVFELTITFIGEYENASTFCPTF